MSASKIDLDLQQKRVKTILVKCFCENEKAIKFRNNNRNGLDFNIINTFSLDMHG